MIFSPLVYYFFSLAFHSRRESLRMGENRKVFRLGEDSVHVLPAFSAL